MQREPKALRLHQSRVFERAKQGLTELGLMTVLFMMYFATRGIAAGKEAVAFANAHQVMDMERRLGLFLEIQIQNWLLDQPFAVQFLNFIYAYTHMTGLILFGAWAFIFHVERYRQIRFIFLSILAIGLSVYILYPLAPPRFFPYTGFVDTLLAHSSINYDQPSLAMLYNPFAAMPSLHVAFSLFVGIGLIRIGRKMIHWILGVAHPTLMTMAVVATGNHFIVDAIAGFILTVAAYYFVPRLMALFAAYQEERQAAQSVATQY